MLLVDTPSVNILSYLLLLTLGIKLNLTILGMPVLLNVPYRGKEIVKLPFLLLYCPITTAWLLLLGVKVLFSSQKTWSSSLYLCLLLVKTRLPLPNVLPQLFSASVLLHTADRFLVFWSRRW